MLGFGVRVIEAIWPTALAKASSSNDAPRLLPRLGNGLSTFGVLLFCASPFVRWVVIVDKQAADVLLWAGVGLWVIGGIVCYVSWLK